MALKNLYDSKPIKIHILGQPAEGELNRPFKATSLFGESACGLSYWQANPDPVAGAAGNPETDKAAIDEAEKRIGAKKED